jgi:AraC-like DNA-binding protein
VDRYLYQYRPVQFQLLYASVAFGEEGNWEHKNQSSPFWRLYWNSGEGAAITLGDRRVALTPSITALIAPNTPFDKTAWQPVEHFHVHFLAGVPYDAITSEIFELTPDSAILDSMRWAIDRIRAGMQQSVGFESMCTYLAFWALKQIPERYFSDHPYSDPRVEQVCRYVDKNLGAAISNADMARVLRINEGSFGRLFKSLTDLTPQQYVESRRVARACALLQHTDMSIDQIAQATGFFDRSHFTRVFAKHKGTGPAAYRKQRF